MTQGLSQVLGEQSYVILIRQRRRRIWVSVIWVVENLVASSTPQYYVYIMTNRSRTLYTGVTNNLERRVYEHKHKLIEGFTKKYSLTRLVYYETTNDVESAIRREKQIKGWLRSKKVALIESVNSQWRDLSDKWYDAVPDPSLRSG